MRRIVQNTVILLGVNLSSAIFGLMISVAIGRSFGSDGLGSYSLVMAWTFALGIFAEFGMNTLITRDVARQRDRADEYLLASSIAKIALSLALSVGLFVSASLLSRVDETVIALRFGAVLILLNALYGSFTAIFRAFERTTPILILNAGGLIIQLAGTIALIAKGQSVSALVALAVAIQILQVVAAFVIYARAFPHQNKIRIERAQVVQLLRAALPFAIAGMVSAVEMRANYVFLGLLQDERSVGLYSAASRFTEAAKFLPNAFFGAIFPAFAAMGAGAVNYFRRARSILVLFALGAALATSLLARPILALSFGSGFENAQSALVILAWSLVPALVNGLTMLFLYARGDESFANKALFVSLLIQLIAAVPLVSIFGSTGAALDALIGDVALFFLLRKNVFFSLYAFAKRAAMPLLIFLVAIFLRIWLVYQTQFDGLYGQDPYAYLDYATSLKFSLVRGELPPPFFWPLGYPALVALVSIFIPMTIAAQSTNVIITALAAVVVYIIVTDILQGQSHAKFSGFVAALVFASAGQMMISSLSGMSDASAVFWATLATFALVRSRRDSPLRWIALAGFALGFAVMTRWVYALLIPVWIVAILSLRKPVLSWSKEAGRRSNLQPSQKLLRLVGSGVLVAIVFFLIALSPQLILMLYHSLHGTISNIGDLQTVSWNLTNAWQSNIINGDGRFLYSVPIAAFYAQPLAHPAFIFPLLTPLLLLGAWSLRRERFPLILLVGWIVLVWLFLSGIAWENPRFSLALFVPLCILVGVGFNTALETYPRFKKLAWVWAIGAIALTIAWGIRATDNFVAQQRTDRAVANWTNAQLPSNSTVISFGITETLRHRTPFRIVEIYNESPESLERILSASQPIFVLLDTSNIESQWKNLTPEVNFRALQSKSDLRLVATLNPYTLFSIIRSP